MKKKITKKKRTKKMLVMLFAVCLTVALLPITAFAADANSDGYDDDDVAAIQAIINASPTLQAKFGDTADPFTWANEGLVEWSIGSPQRVSYLDLSQFITDFSGTLDASALTALEKLYCDNNKGLTKLTLPQAGSLTDLWCYNTGITELEVSGCLALKNLECNNTGISALDISKNTALTYLNCNNTNISSLDISQNTALTHLNCYKTNISSLDISQNTALNNLNCDNTNISSLDISQNTALTHLNCNNTNISSLDISQNTALTYLYCSNTDITKLDVSTNQSLTDLSLPESLEALKTSGENITLTRTQGGKIMLSLGFYDSGALCYRLKAEPEPGYEFVRWKGVTNFVNRTTENDAIVDFEITGDMNISAEFSEEERLSLASLDVEGVTLTPAFSSDILNYTAVVPYDVTSINIVAEGMADHEHTITGTGKHELEVGENTFVVAVIVPKVPGDININEMLRKEYVITVTRQADPESTDVPTTGDDSNIGLWVGLMMIGFAGAIVWTVAWGRKRTN